MKRKTIGCLIINCLMLLTSCQYRQNQIDEAHAAKKIFAMNTMIDISIYGPRAHAVATQVEEKINHLDNLLSTTLQNSDIVKLNASPDAWVTVEEDTSTLLNRAWQYQQLTNGAFCPIMGTLINLWGINVGNKQVPEPKQIEEARTSIDEESLLVGSDRQYMLTNDAKIDLGGIGKGYATDKVAEILDEKKVDSALISLGFSSVLAYGDKPDGSAWRVGVRDFDSSDNAYFGVVSLKDEFLSTTGDYEHFFIQDGVRYHHVLDPKTGYPADSGLRSVTVISNNGAMSDAYSTALMVMGLEKALNFQKEQGNFEAIFVTEKKQIVCTDGIRDDFEFTGEKAGYTYA